MKLFHWKFKDYNLIVGALTEDDARKSVVNSINGWLWQDPDKFNAMLVDVQQPPYFVANEGYVITFGF